MNYYLDTEFLEGAQRSVFGATKPTIDLISIGIVSEDNREYYAISKDFNIKEAWYRFQLENDTSVGARIGCIPSQKKVYWIRENVLKLIHEELSNKEVDGYKGFTDPYYELDLAFTYTNFKRLVKKYGKSNKDIAKEVIKFCSQQPTGIVYTSNPPIIQYDTTPTKFYGYYCDYDWVVFCWLFGKMIDLPEGFPMYCHDLKQTKDFIIEKASSKAKTAYERYLVQDLDSLPNYPKQVSEHNALEDAKWNKQLHKFLNELL